MQSDSMPPEELLLDHPPDGLARAAEEHTDRRAVVFQDRSLNYRELEKQVIDFCNRLSQWGAGSVLGVDAANPWLVLCALHATARLGRALLPLELGISRSRQHSLIRQSGCSLVIGADSPADQPKDIPWIASESLLHEGASATGQISASVSISHDPDTILLIIPTSGTTGKPKGVMLSRRNLVASASQVNRELALKPGDCWLDCLPLSHIAGLSIIYRCVLAGATLVLHQGFDAKQVWLDLERQRITHLSLVPAMLKRLLEVAGGRHPPESLAVALIGGASLDTSLAREAHDAGWPLVISYGMSETGSMCAVDKGSEAGLRASRVGCPLQGFHIELSESNKGRLRVAGDAVMSGYANPQLTPGDGLDNGWFETGDLAYWDDENALCISGRMDELLNSGGRRIHPREVEELLEVCPGLSGVAVASRHDPVWGDYLVAIYTGEMEEPSLESWSRAHLPSGLRPRTFKRVDVLPINRMGKLDRQALKQFV